MYVSVCVCVCVCVFKSNEWKSVDQRRPHIHHIISPPRPLPDSPQHQLSAFTQKANPIHTTSAASLLFLQERSSEDSKEAEAFQDLLTARTQEFVEELLVPHFGGMITFVRDCENLQEKGQLDTLRDQERESPVISAAGIAA